MPSLVRKRSALHLTDDSDEDEPSSRAPSTLGPQRKRVRPKIEYRNGRSNGRQHDHGDADIDGGDDDAVDGFDGNVLPEADSDYEEEELLGQPGVAIGPNTQPFQLGSIVRIKVQNFVTYTQVEVFPGPNLNMVIGPNGTGKSTIVCAICLGLGWSPVHLGRAKEISEFVKHGCQEATVEIELQGNEGERNPIIKRKIGRENNHSSFTLNGKTITPGKVSKFVKSFNIQIDNLCQFLPQDRVVEFAGLTPIDLLKETQRAAAPPEILKCHEELKKLGKTQKHLVDELEIDRAQLSQLEARQAALQQDVERLRERQEVMRKIRLMEKARPFVEYRMARSKAKEIKEERIRAEKELAEIERQVEPMTEAPKNKKKYQKLLEKCVAERKKAVEDKEKEVTKFKDTVITKVDDKVKELKGKMEAARDAEKSRKAQLVKEKERIVKIKNQLENQPPEVDLAYYNAKIGESNHQVRDTKQKIEDVDAEIKPLVERGNQISTQISRRKEELVNLNSVTGARENMLQRISKDTYQAWKWVKSHPDDFDEEILGPPVLTCSVKHPKYADAVEQQLGRNDKVALVAQNKKDYRKLLSVCFGDGGLRLRDVTIRESSNSTLPPSPMTKEAAQRMGFDGFSIDFMEGPAPVLAMLCIECGVNRTPISFKEFSASQNKAMEDTGVGRWITGRNMYTLRRRYGSSLTQMSTVRNAQAFAAQQVDAQAEQAIRRSISELEGDLEDIKAKINELKRSRDDFHDQFKQAQDRNRKFKDEKAAKQKESAGFVRLKASLAGLEEELARKTNGGKEYKENMQKREEKMEALVMDRASQALQLARLVRSLVEVHNDLILCQLREAEATSDVEILQHKIEETLQMVNAKRTEYSRLKEATTQANNSARKLQNNCRRVLEELTPEDSDFMNNIPLEKTIEDIETDIEAEVARLELLHEGNPNAIKQFEERTAKIQNLKTKISARETDLETHAANIAGIRNQWEPEVDRLIAKISSAFSKSFDKINCAGEVRLHKEDDDYEKWAVQILVKFREKEKLQVLDNRRQSGGERAVSTVFYLMALQSLARSPFRVVDEINQGMDPRNERLVHHRMVNIACQEFTSQYFLITPKLLPDLMYHPRMKIHCIYSGDWIQEGARLDVDEYLKIGAKLKAQAMESDA